MTYMRPCFGISPRTEGLRNPDFLNTSLFVLTLSFISLIQSAQLLKPLNRFYMSSYTTMLLNYPPAGANWTANRTLYYCLPSISVLCTLTNP